LEDCFGNFTCGDDFWGTASNNLCHKYSGMSIIQGIFAGAIGWVTYVINLILGFIAGILFEIGGSLVQFALDLNSNIVSQPIVIIGWQILLNFANLGFVLAIIVIAFATIFRVQSYAMKQTLWKLIVAALLVNFSLVIAGAFINVADIVTNSFQKESKLGPMEAATTLAKAFDIQRLLQVGGSGGPAEEICWWRGEGLNLAITGPKVLGLCSRDPKTGQPEASQWTLKDLHKTCICEKVDSQQKQKILMAAARGGDELTGPLLAAIASIFFTVAFTLIGAITLLALAIMLIIRFIALGLLLVLSPLALLFWIFPATQNLWKKWWDNFFRWTFFAPAVSFFLFLAVKATENLAFTDPSSSAVNKAIEGALLQHGAVVFIGNMVILLGFLLGGLYVANSLSITFAGTAYGWAGSIGKGFGGWVGRKTLEGTGRRILSSERVKGWTEKLSASKVPGARFIGQGINRLGARVEEVTKKPYEELAKRLATNPERLNSEILASRGAKRAVLLSQAAKTKDIGREVQERFINDPEIYTDIEKEFKLSGLDFGALQKTVGRSPKMAQAKTNEELKKATDEFVQSLTPKDYAKGQWNDVFKKTEDEQSKRIQESLATAFAQYEHGAYAKTIPHIKGENLRRFEEIMEDGIETAKKQAKEIKDFEESARVFKYASEAADRLGKTLNRRAMFGGEEAWVPPSPPS